MSVFASCACCAACRPRYKRLVDSIYPANPEHGVVKANMQKLTFYAISHSEKLDRIGDYLAYRLSRDVYRQRVGYVRVSVEAMDSLLAACHGSASLNLFVESFLKVIQRLLETQQPEFEVLATDSFVSFANIEEDTPSYHRRYDFFISKFSSLCHSSHPQLGTRRKLRGAGIKGLRGVVRKTVSDDLQANIWEKQHMEKIVPSLLFNMHDDLGEDVTDKSTGDSTAVHEEAPNVLSDSCLRELIGKATFGNMKCVLQPVLNHFDLHNLWTQHPPTFAASCFEAIMYSIQAQYSYVVIQALINHLDQHSSDKADVRVGIATVLSRIVLIAATASIGPTLLEIFNSLLRHLRQSVDLQFGSSAEASDGEKLYQETLINTMGDFANTLPDYQKVEIMMFIIGKVPLQTSERRAEMFLQKVLVRTLLKVATKYRTRHLATVLTSTVLEPLLQLALVEDPSVRELVQEILHTLLDRHQNLPRLVQVGYAQNVDDLNLTVEKCSRTDAMFMKKNGYPICSTLYKCALAPGNTSANFDAILCTMALLCAEVGCDEVIVDLYRLALGLQAAAADGGTVMSKFSRIELHNLVAMYVNLSAQLLAIPALCQHVQQVVKSRTMTGVHPKYNLLDASEREREDERENLVMLADEMLFDKAIFVEALKSRNFDVIMFNMPFVPRPTTGDLAGATAVDAGSISLDITSVDSASLDGNLRKQSRRNTILGVRLQEGVPLPITVSTLRQVVNQPAEYFEKLEADRNAKVAERFRTTPFDILVVEQKENCTDINESVAKILQSVKDKEAATYGDSPSAGGRHKMNDIFELEFPDLFVY